MCTLRENHSAPLYFHLWVVMSGWSSVHFWHVHVYVEHFLESQRWQACFGLGLQTLSGSSAGMLSESCQDECQLDPSKTVCLSTPMQKWNTEIKTVQRWSTPGHATLIFSRVQVVQVNIEGLKPPAADPSTGLRTTSQSLSTPWFCHAFSGFEVALSAACVGVANAAFLACQRLGGRPQTLRIGARRQRMRES